MADGTEDPKMANTDPAFTRISLKQSGFYVWRIENMQVVQQPKEFHGEFYKGDSYIVLSITGEGQAPKGMGMQVKEMKGALDVHIHFWLGSETSQDEAGVAAYKSVELDDYLGGAAVQHREVEGQESKRFKSYFTAGKGLQYLDGGVKSGFNHVDKTYKPRLIQVKGKNFITLKDVPMEWDSMNSGDCFILHLGQIIYVWTGKQCRRQERIKAMQVARQYKDERPGGCNLEIVEEGGETNMAKDALAMFEKYLPLKERPKIKSAEEGGADEVVTRNSGSQIKLFSCREEGGTLKLSEVKSGPLSKKDLNSDDCYIVDNGPAGIWVWIGKRASPKEKKEAMRNALGFLTKKDYPKQTQVTRVVEGGEDTEFKCLFRDWPQPPASNRVHVQNRIAKTVQTKFDAVTLHDNPRLAAETQMIDDGSGTVTVYRVDNFELIPVDKSKYGEFYGGDCYVIQYDYQLGGRENHIIYYWLGMESSQDEQGTAALKAVELDDKLGGAATQIRVVQNKEPPHFMTMFGGKMVVFEGGKAGWGQGGTGNAGPGEKYMLQVRGYSPLNTKAVQVTLSATSLNSNDVFVIFTKSQVYIWAGKGCTGDEREMAKIVASRSPRNVTMVFEGQEKEDFWTVLGGKEPYASDKRLQDDDNSHPPRLFQLSNASGNFTCDEIPDFVQNDLNTQDVMILDAWDVVFLWMGEGANKDEKKEAERLAIEYLRTDPAGRDLDTPIVKIKQGYEPPSFTGFFGAWDRDWWSKGMSYEDLKQELTKDNQPLEVVKQTVANGAPGFEEVSKYPYEKLAVASEELPSDVDPTCREIHLLSADFERLFKMTYAEFSVKPEWKQKDMKKNLKLF